MSLYVTGNYVGRTVWRDPVATAAGVLEYVAPVQATSFDAPVVSRVAMSHRAPQITPFTDTTRPVPRSASHTRWLDAGIFSVLLGLATFSAATAMAEESPPVFCLPSASRDGVAERLVTAGLLAADARVQPDRVRQCPGIGLRFADRHAIAAFARRLDSAQRGYQVIAGSGHDAEDGSVVVAEAQVMACADRVRQHVAASSGQSATLSFAGILTDRQRSALARHGILGAKGTLNAALAQMTPAERSNPSVVADLIATQLRQGPAVFFWDGDKDLDTDNDRFVLAPEAYVALRAQVQKELATASMVAARYPPATEASSFVRRGLATNTVRANGRAVDAATRSSETPAPETTTRWPWILGGGVTLLSLLLALRSRHRRRVAASTDTPRLPVPAVEPTPSESAAPASAPTALHEASPAAADGTVPNLRSDAPDDVAPDMTGPMPIPEIAPPPVPETDPLIGRVIDGKYRITGHVGKGGMARVYEGEQLTTGRPIALKVLAGKVASDSDEARRFRQEVRSAAMLRHPHTVQMIDFGHAADDDLLYLVMELLEGETLHTLLRKGPVPIPRAIQIAIQILKSLAEAHTKGIVHRDLKPGNIMLTTMHGEPGDFVKVIDFGIAKVFVDGKPIDPLTMVGAVMGTPEYMSPEQAASKPVDARSDLYAVGIILYQMLAGRRPFVEDTPVGYLIAHIQTPPEPLVIPSGGPEHAALVTLVHRALEKDPARRPRTAEAFLSELTGIFRNFFRGGPNRQS